MSYQEDAPVNKSELEAEMDREWSRLQALIDRLGEARLTGPTDGAGWTGKDHLANLAAWARSIVFLLQGRPRHEGLGVNADLYFSHDVDAVNEVIFLAHRDESLDAVLDDLRATHTKLREMVAAMSDDDLSQPYSHFLPDEPGQDDGRPILTRISGNAGAHYAEHIPWIEAITVST